MFIIKNYKLWIKYEINITNIRENRVYDTKINYSRKSFGQKLVNYLGPKFFNLMPTGIKKYIYSNTGNLKITYIKKIIVNWLITSIN